MVALVFFVACKATTKNQGQKDAADLKVVLEQLAPLTLAEIVPGDAFLEGSLVANLQNTGTRTIYPEDLHVHNLLFTNKLTGEKFVVVHSCDCGLVTQKMAAPPRRNMVLNPHETKAIVLDEWDCSGGGWEPPPAGDYLVTYRIHATTEKPQPAATNPIQKFNVQEVIKECRDRLLSDEFWKNAVVSEPLAITIR